MPVRLDPEPRTGARDGGEAVSRLAAIVLALVAMQLAPAAHAGEASPPSCRDIIAAHEGMGEPGWYMEGAVPGAVYVSGETLADLDGFIALVDRHRGVPVIVEGGNFEDWDFSIVGPPVRSVCFRKARLARSTWHREDFPGLGFIDSDLTRANFGEAGLRDVLLQNATLDGATMAGAVLDGGLYTGGWNDSIDGWDLSGASLRGFRFVCGREMLDGCPLGPSGINLAGADLTRADLSLFGDWSGADFSGARLNATVIAPRQVPDFVLAEIVGGVVLRGGAYRVSITADELRALQHEAGEHASDSAGPSFPCHQAGNRVERIICSEFEARLRQRDLELAWLYSQARERGRADPGAQKAWLAQRNRCADADCIARAYDMRIDALAGLLGAPDPVFGGQSAYFMHPSLPLGRAFRSEGLHARALPALVGDADIGAVIHRQADGRFSIAGKAVGVNGHMCTLLAGNLAFDPASGWFAQQQGDGRPPVRLFQLIDETLHIVRGGHPEYDPEMAAGEYLTCGARAAFVPMTRIATEPGALAAMMRFFEF